MSKRSESFELTPIKGKIKKGKLKKEMKNRELQEITKAEYENLDWEANSFHCIKHKNYWYAGGNQAVYCKDCEGETKLKIINKIKKRFKILDCECELSSYKRLEYNNENFCWIIIGAALKGITKEEFIKRNVVLEVSCKCGNNIITSISSTEFLELESTNRKKQIKKLEIENQKLQENIKRLNKEIAKTEKIIRILNGEN